jgi:hypothetical protein
MKSTNNVKSQKKVIKLTHYKDYSSILIGTDSIISIKTCELTDGREMTKIQSRGAMIENNIVTETIDEIWQLINE